MSKRVRPRAGSYARAVERGWAELCGRAVILSPRDWALLDDWFQRGIPLQIIQEAIDAAAQRGSGSAGQGPRSLSYIAPAVEEAWKVVVEGRLADPSEPAPAGRDLGEPGEVIQAWRECRERQAQGTALRRLLEELIAAFESGAPEEDLDARLNAEIGVAAPPELLAEVEDEIGAELESYRRRMKPEALLVTRRRAVARRLRLKLVLPRLEQQGDD